MSMKMLTILQLAGIFSLYTALTVLAPALVFRKKVKDKRLPEQFMIYFTIGNFYVMHIVFFLQLLHISNRLTLLIATLLPGVIMYVRQAEGKAGLRLLRSLETLNKATHGIMGWKTFLKRMRDRLWIAHKALFRWVRDIFGKHFAEWVLMAFAIGAVLWIYGNSYTNMYGYSMSDVPVHNYWINSMSDNDIYVAGVYPFGFHCMIYYMHAVFGIDTFVLLRVFGLTQAIYVNLMLILFIRGITKSKYAAYIASGIYTLSDLYNTACTSRFLGAIPQEFGMIFILPAIYFAIRFFSTRKEELANGVKGVWHTDSTWYLAGYAMNFGMTLAVHFYDTMIAGIFCIAVAFGFCFRFCNIHYMGRVMAALCAAILIGALPMVIAVLCGKPLQGSLGWGMNVLNATKNSSSTTQTTSQPESQASGQWESSAASETAQESDAVKESDSEQASGAVKESGSATESTAQESGAAQTQPAAVSGTSGNKVKVSIQERMTGIYKIIKNSIKNNIIRLKIDNYLKYTLYGIAFAAAVGILMIICRNADYGGSLLSVAVMSLLMQGVIVLKALGLPQLMDVNRARIYYEYIAVLLMAMVIDAAVSLIWLITRQRWLMNILSFACFAAILWYGVQFGHIRQPLSSSFLETNGAITCLTNILRENKDNTWTIVSANDELRMIDKRGYHYETITFLKKLESRSLHNDLIVNTPYVYFYIEKQPLDYAVKYINSGQLVSEEGAKRPLPSGKGLSVYQGENRWVVMSKMYYWAQEYRRLYPNEMQVYYEDDKFVCYRLEQNMYSLYNFDIR